MKWPWRYRDADGDFLEVRPADGSERAAVETDGGITVYVTPDRIPGITAKLYEACGVAPPVLLERPEMAVAVRPDSHLSGERWTACLDGRRVAVTVSGPLSPQAARVMAACAAALAEAAGGEPDRADVDALAMVLVEGRDAMGLDGARPLARRILAAGYRREARDGE
jgi:hypothetical protein